MSCGYDLTGSTPADDCPECGTPVATSLTQRSSANAISPFAIACIITGILSLPCCGLLGPIAIGLFFYTKQEGVYYRETKLNDGLALAGLICGSLGTLLMVAQVILMFVS